MIDTLTISGLGPHRATALALVPKGRTVLVGPSAIGKSTLIDAVSWCLWGVSALGKPIPDALIHDGAEHLEVTVKLGSGATYSRRRKRGGKSGTLTKNDATITTAAEWAEALGPLAKRTDLLRAILAPMSWIPLLQGEGGGRPLRDLLAQVLPVDGLRAVVAEDVQLTAAGGLREGDSVSETECYARRKEANARASELGGKLQAAEERVRTTAGDRVVQPEPEEAQAAKATLDAADAWARYHQGDAARAWEARVAELGERPPEDDKIAKLRAARDDGRKAAEVARAAYETAKAHPPREGAPELDEARAKLATARAALGRRKAAGTACPECQQEIPNAAEALAQAEEAEREAREEHDRIEEECQREHAERVEAHKAEVKRLKSASDVAAKVATNLEADHDRAAATPSARAKWDAATAALGKRPAGLVADRPGCPEPSAQEVAHARDQQARLQQAAGQRREQERERREAVAAEERTRKESEAAKAEAHRLDVLVDAVRRGPSVLAARQVERLGDLGPVQIVFPADGAAVEVLIDGRPWWTASSGRRVIGDLYLRAALRRAAKMSWFPIFVDNVQDFSGAIPDVGGVTVLLRTEPGAELRVVS